MVFIFILFFLLLKWKKKNMKCSRFVCWNFQLTFEVNLTSIRLFNVFERACVRVCVCVDVVVCVFWCVGFVARLISKNMFAMFKLNTLYYTNIERMLEENTFEVQIVSDFFANEIFFCDDCSRLIRFCDDCWSNSR